MAAGRSATPLISLDAVALDTETTGLDPRKARIVELAAVPIAGGRLDQSRMLCRRVRPDRPIPASATRIHGIEDAAVADAPRFGAVWPEYAGLLGDAVVIGHSIGFDVAVIHRECERAGVSWPIPPTLDVALLAQIVAPALASHSLESLAAWLGIEITGRHSASGDAEAAGRIFCALVPKLRECGIRTLAEAMRACDARHDDASEERRRAGWGESAPVWRVTSPERPRVPADTEPYRHQVSGLMSPARSIGAEAKLGDALRLIAEERISSLFVSPTGGSLGRPEEVGIITERDILRAIHRHGAAALQMPVGEAMSRPLVTVAADTLAYVAIGRMNRLGIRHLGVTDAVGAVVGALTTRDLLRSPAESAIELGDELATAKDIHDLGRSWAKLAQVTYALVADGLSGREIAAVISQNVVETTRRSTQLAEAKMVEAGRGGPPCRYAVVVLGSAGRGESLLALDQDNALIHADDAPPEADDWFAPFAEHLNRLLHEVGIPYCKGGVMAKNPQWRGSQAQWRQRVEHWISRAAPEDLLSVDIFFDLRIAHGDAVLADRLWCHAFETARGQTGFAKQLIAAIGDRPPGRTWYGGLRTEHGRIDLKRAGLFGIVSVARALAVCHHVVERSTPARLAGLMALKLGLESDLDALTDAQGAMLDLMLVQQVDDITHGRPASNAVEVKRLSQRERARLKGALQAVENLDAIARDLLFRG